MFYGIVVLYNKNYNDSQSLSCLLSSRLFAEGKLHVMLVDNSTKDFGNSEAGEKSGITYISMDGNKGLPKAYNRALDEISKNTDISGHMIMIFDDDTTIPEAYFTEAEEAASHDADLFFPMVQAGEMIMSPCRIQHKIPRPVPDFGNLDGLILTGINSSMMIRGSAFKNYRYDENIFLDYVDHDFVRSMRSEGKKIEVMKTVIKQDFSRETDNYQAAIHRFKIFKKDLKVYYKKEKGGMPVYHLLILVRKLRMLKKYKKISILAA